MSKQEIVKLGKLEFDLRRLTKFIVIAKKKGYAGDGEYKTLKDGSKLFTFQEGDFYYEDRYSGSAQAPGRELVKWKDNNGQWLWYMSYVGGMLPKYQDDEKLAEKTFVFLKQAVSKIPLDKPFRGPSQYESPKEKDMFYVCKIDGDIKRFKGKEMIASKKHEGVIFSQDVVGGLVI